MAIIKEALDPNFLFGNPYNYSLDNRLIFPSGNLILDTLKETGIVGLIGFVGLILIGVKVAITYLNLSTDSVVTKNMVIAFLLTLLTRYMLRYPFNQLTFTDSYWDINYFPFVESKEFAISLFLLGYMYIAKPLTIKPNLEEATVNE
jgi:O-antigen ligase